MRSYVNLSDHDFEHLVADLLGTHLNKRFEVFARGADKGVDLRHIRSDGIVDIVQCKHYRKSTFSHLKSAAGKERRNLDSLDESIGDYFFITSQELTAANKSELQAILGPYCPSTNSIMGADDLESLLNSNSKVERAHTKLWLSGAAQLSGILHGDIWNRSRRLIVDIERTLPRYVETGAFSKAWRRLRSQHVLIISGPPGIGKSTLARMLLANAVRWGYEPIEISRDIDEANRVLDRETRQAFYYDDFLGSTFLQSRLEKNEDKRLTAFIGDCVDNPRTLFVLTTREHILQQAKFVYEDLDRAELDLRKMTLSISTYSLLDRARILYNHVWHSDAVNEVARNVVAKPINYHRILGHRHYNPRVIEYVTGLASYRLTEADSADYANFIVGVLDDPSMIWKHAFSRQLDDDCKDLLIAMSSLGSQVRHADLAVAFEGQLQAQSRPLTAYAMHTALRVLNETFVRSVSNGDGVLLNYANPSVGDFVYSWLQGDEREARTAIAGARFYEQLRPLYVQVASKFQGDAKKRLTERICDAVIDLWESPVLKPLTVAWRLGRRKPSQLGRRLIFLLELTSSSSAAKIHLASFCSAQARVWADSLDTSPVDLSQRVEIGLQLHSHGLLDPLAAKALHESVRGSASDADEWRLLGDLHRILGASISLDEQQSALDRAREWVEEQLLHAADDLLSGSHELIDARDLADELGIDYDYDEFESAINTLEEAQSEARAREDREHDQEDDGEGEAESEEEKEEREVDRLFLMLRSDEDDGD